MAREIAGCRGAVGEKRQGAGEGNTRKRRGGQVGGRTTEGGGEGGKERKKKGR